MTDAKRDDELFTIQEALQIADQMDNAMLMDSEPNKRDANAEWLRTWGMTPEYEQTTSGPKLLGEHDLLDPEDRKMFDAIADRLESDAAELEIMGAEIDLLNKEKTETSAELERLRRENAEMRLELSGGDRTHIWINPADHERLREENEGMRRLTQVSQDEAARLRDRLADIDSRTKADADDLAKMRDGTKLTRAGIVEALVYQQQEIDTKEMLLGRLGEENRKWQSTANILADKLGRYTGMNVPHELKLADALVKETDR